MAALKKKTSRKVSNNSLADTPSSSRSAAAPSSVFNNPVNPGGMPFPNPSDFNVPPFGTPMQGVPMPGGLMPPPGMIPPISGAPIATPSDDLLASVGNMLRMGVDAVSAVLAGGTRIMQGFAEQGHHGGLYGHEYYGPHGMHHSGGHHHPHGHCCRSHDPACCYPSCCDCYGQSCCHPSVHGCD